MQSTSRPTISARCRRIAEIAVFAGILILSTSGAGVAQGTPRQTGQSGSNAPATQAQSARAGIDARCEDGRFIGQCKETCRTACDNDRQFFQRHRTACSMIGARGTDPVSCNAPGAVVSVSTGGTNLKNCLIIAAKQPSNADNIKKLASRPKMQEHMRTFFDGFPGCVKSVPELVDQFDCYKVEGDELKASYDKLKAKGYRDADRTRICQLTHDEMLIDSDTNEALSARAEQLKGDFSTLSSCRLAVDKWLEQRAEGKIWDDALKDLKEDLAPATKIEPEIQSLTGTLQAELKSLQQVFTVALVRRCPTRR